MRRSGPTSSRIETTSPGPVEPAVRPGPEIGQNEKPAVGRDRAGPSLEQDAVGALGQDHLGIVDAIKLAGGRQNR